MILIHKRKFDYSFEKDGKTHSGSAYQAVFLSEYGYKIEKINERIYTGVYPVNIEYTVLYDKYGKVVELVKGGS